MYVTNDKYELPIAIADNAKDLAKMLGTTRNAINTFISRPSSCRNRKGKFIRIWIDEYEEDEGVEENEII